MSKSILGLFCFACLFIACSSPSNEKTEPEAEQSSTSTETTAQTTTSSKIAGIGACTLLSEATLQSVLSSPKGFNFNERNDDKGRSVQCNVGLKEGFGSVMWAVTYFKNGHASNAERYAKNAAFVPMEIAGADGAYINETMKVVKAWKGDYLVTLNLPVTQAKMNDYDWMKSQGKMITEELLANF